VRPSVKAGRSELRRAEAFLVDEADTLPSDAPASWVHPVNDSAKVKKVTLLAICGDDGIANTGERYEQPVSLFVHAIDVCR
jgi:hypothetical protein